MYFSLFLWIDVERDTSSNDDERIRANGDDLKQTTPSLYLPIDKSQKLSKVGLFLFRRMLMFFKRM